MRDPIRLLFMTGDDVLATGVKAFTLSPASHAAIAMGPYGNMLLHAITPGVVYESRWNFYQRAQYRDVAEYLIIPDVSDGLRRALMLIGQKFDVGGAASQFAFKLARIVCPWLPKTLSTSGRWTCTQLVMQLDSHGQRIPEWRGLDDRSVTAAELMAVAETSPSFKRVA